MVRREQLIVQIRLDKAVAIKNFILQKITEETTFSLLQMLEVHIRGIGKVTTEYEMREIIFTVMTSTEKKSCVTCGNSSYMHK